MSLNNERTFTVVGSSISVIKGRYVSSTPYSAARKAATQQFKKAKADVKKIKFLLKETTQNSPHKTYFYVATREKLNTPLEREIVINGVKKTIKNEYTTKLEKCNTGAHDSIDVESSS